MFDPTLYPHHSTMQRRDASYVIDRYFKLLKWHQNENILDVGTGDGSVLLDFVFPKLPKNFKKLTALDIDDNMLNVARNNFKNYSKVNFCCMDIALKPTPGALVKNFDHIFSFYCLHYVNNQRELMQILFNMLKPGGEMFLLIGAKYPLFAVYKKLAETIKWKPFMETAKNISPYQYSPNPVEEVEDFLKNAGFERYKCDLLDLKFTYQHSEFLTFHECVDPFIKIIPKSETENYTQDFLKELEKLEAVKIEHEDRKENRICLSYQSLVVFASKGI